MTLQSYKCWNILSHLLYKFIISYTELVYIVGKKGKIYIRNVWIPIWWILLLLCYFCSFKGKKCLTVPVFQTQDFLRTHIFEFVHVIRFWVIGIEWSQHKLLNTIYKVVMFQKTCSLSGTFLVFVVSAEFIYMCSSVIHSVFNVVATVVNVHEWDHFLLTGCCLGFFVENYFALNKTFPFCPLAACLVLYVFICVCLCCLLLSL